MPDAIVVGSGPNGLVAAGTLAQQGLSVLVLEAAATPGGGVRSAELTLPGVAHDVCATVMPMAACSPALGRIGVDVDWVHPEVPLAQTLERGAVVVQRDIDDTAMGLGRDAGAWRALFGDPVGTWSRLSDDLLGPPRVPRHPLAVARFGLRALRSASSVARSAFADEPARALFAGLAAHSFIPLEAAGSASFGLILALTSHAVGWPMPRGGAGALTSALLLRLASLGVRVEVDSEVRSLRDLPPARAILLDLTPRQVLRVCGDRLPPRYRRALVRYRLGPGAFKMDWTLDGPIPWSAPDCSRAGVVHVAGSLDEIAESERAPWRGAVAERPFVLMAQPSLFDATRAPAGLHVAWGYCHVPNGWTGDATELIERQVERFAPGFRQRIVARAASSPAAIEARNANCAGGDITGGAQDLRQTLLRPVASLAPHVTPLTGVYLCSSSTPPGAGVHGACGFHAAREALRRTFGVRIEGLGPWT